MKNNKGFLVYEMVVAFSITIIIGITLISTTFILKNKSDFINIETLLVTNKSLLLKEIKTDMVNDSLIDVKKCSNRCIELIYNIKGSKKIIIDNEKRTIEYGNFKKKYDDNIDLSKSSTVTNQVVNNVVDGFNNSFLIINIPIFSNQLNEDYGIKLIYQYDNRLQTFTDINF